MDANNINRTINEFQEMMRNVDMESFPPLDQLTITTAYIEMIEKVRPIYLKNMAKNNASSSYLYKL